MPVSRLPKSQVLRVIDHPRTSIVLALSLGGAGFLTSGPFAFLLFLMALLLVLWSAWEWNPVRSRMPFTFRSPIVGRGGSGPLPIPADLGRVDFELYMKKALDSSANLLNQMTKEMAKNTTKVTKQANKLRGLQGTAVETRHRALQVAGKLMLRHARRLDTLERAYRTEVDAICTNSKRWLESTPVEEDLDHFGRSVAGLRESTVGSKSGIETYRLAAANSRSLNISQAVNGASDELVAVLSRITEDANTIISYCDWVSAFLTRRAKATGP